MARNFPQNATAFGKVSVNENTEQNDASRILVQDETTKEINWIDKDTIATSEQLALKLNISDYNEYFQGKYISLVALQTAKPTGNDGDYAIVDPGTGVDALEYIWDTDEGWVLAGAASASTTDALPEGSTNLYFTTARVLDTLLTGISFITGGAIVSTDTILVAFGKIQKQINDLSTIYQAILTDVIFGTFITSLTAKTVIVDADTSIISDSADSGKAKKVTLSNIFNYIRLKLDMPLSYACSDETSDLAVGTLITFRMPIGLTLTALKLSLNVAPTGSKVIVDVRKNGTTILSTLISADISSTTSVGAAIPYVISDTNLTDDSIITILTTQVGSTIAGKGLKVTFIGKRI